MSAEGIREALPYLIPKLNRAVVMSVELKDSAYALHSKGTPKEMNSLGARQTIKLAVNSNYGNKGEGDYFREGGKHNAKQAIIGFTRDSITHALNDDYFDNVEGTDAIGGKMADLMKDNIAYMKKQRDIDFCHGDGKGTRGTVSSVSGTTIIIFTSEEGSRFTDKNEFYFFHHPTTGAIHGSTSGHQVVSIDSTTQATFTGDLTSGTTVAANDLMVHKGTADNESSYNRALYGYEYFFLDSGAYFGLDKDTESLLRGLRVNAQNLNVSFSLLEKGITKWQYRWNEEPDGLIDMVPPCQIASYKKLGYPIRRIGADDKSFDGGITKVTDGQRTMYSDANIRPTNWFRYKQSCIQRYEFKATGVWTRDGNTYRTIYGNNSNKSEIYWIIDGKEQMFCDQPAHGIWYYNLGTSGVETGI